MKKTCSVIVVLCIIFCLFTSVSANPNSEGGWKKGSESKLSFVSEKELVKLTIRASSEVDVTPTEAYTLLDTSGNLTIVCVEFVCSDGKIGFALVDLTEYSVTMYALDAVIPFDADDKVICDGVLGFAVINENSDFATVLGTNTVIPTASLYNDSRENLATVTDSQKNEILNALQERCLANAKTRATDPGGALVVGGSDPNLVYNAGTNDGDWDTDCGINAVAMYLRHIDVYFNSTYVHASHPTEPTLKSALAGIAWNKWKITTAISMGRLATLTNEYLSMYGASSVVEVSNVNYTWSSYVSQINYGNGRPCILYIGGGQTSYWSSAHAVLGVGYTAGSTATTGYVIANSGWTSLRYVHISTDIPGSMIK